MLHNKRNSLGTRKVSPPQPTCMSAEQQGELVSDQEMAPRSPPWESKYSHLASATYLSNLRNNRPARPTGSRPLPSKSIQDENLPPRAESSLSFRTSRDRFVEDDSKERKLVHRASLPTSNSYGSLASQKGRPLVPTPSSTMNSVSRKVSPPMISTPDIRYRENAARIKEREEAQKLRETLDEMKTDKDEDEGRIHEAAKLEAADLVWKHRHPDKAEVEKTAAYRNPDIAKDFEELTMVKVRTPAPRLESNTKSRSTSTESKTEDKPRLPWLRKRTKIEQPQTPQKEHESILQKSVRKFSGKRQSSGGSNKSLFRNPEDEIYEEKEEMPTTVESTPIEVLPLTATAGNTLPKGSRPLPTKSMTDPLPIEKPAQVNALRNVFARHDSKGSRALPQTPAKVEEEEHEEEIRYIDGYEVRSHDIRAATSMRKSDRSPNLPTPTAVSDRPGRPIVSFDKKWHPGSESPRNSRELERVQSHKDSAMAYPIKQVTPVPEITILEHPDSPALQKEKKAEETAIPTFSFSIDEPIVQEQKPTESNLFIPTINISVDEPEVETQTTRPLPQISMSDDSKSQKPASRPLPAIVSSRPLPHHTQSAPVKSRPSHSELASRVPWLARTPTSAASVTCTACTLPISGRIVTASGSSAKSQKARFHPECFSCHKCSEGLEAVAFYPEPETARLERIQQAMPHLESDDPQLPEIAQSNEDLRFFCHLDYHELYSPKCHNCKTPIEGAVILALGRHYHADHFFCAECGDPFTSESPFVEHNDYPYCVSCHTKRTSSRCRACKAQILNEMVIEALGGKWHDACFVCCECGGDFGDEGRFFVREIELPLTEKQRRKGLAPVIEEKAACQECEERRVKNVNLFL